MNVAKIVLLVGILYVLIVIASHLAERDGHRIVCDKDMGAAPVPVDAWNAHCRTRAWWLP